MLKKSDPKRANHGSPKALKDRKVTIFVVSDSTGETVNRLVRAALAQFQDPDVEVVRRANISTPRQVRAVIKSAAAHKAVILHTLVLHNLRRLLLQEARLHGVDAMDLMGPILQRLAHRLKLTPMGQPGLFKQLSESRTREIEAVEFALLHDDGQHQEELNRAEIVVVGVSRSMKTPTALYLSYRGWFVANVPLVLEVPPPPELLALPPERVFCFEVAPERLQELRRARAEIFKIPYEPYATLGYIRKELVYGRRLSFDYGWRAIDVTGKSVEEVAHEILVLRGLPQHESRLSW